MRTNDSRASELGVEYTTKPVSGWGGLVSIGRLMEKLGVRELLRRALPDGRTSPNQVPVVDMMVQLMFTVLMGGRRFEHVERIREDEVVRAAAGAKRFGSASSVTRYLGNLLPSQGEHLHECLSQWVFQALSHITSRDVLDLDSTVFQRHGNQEGSTKGYNPVRPGARSHHPLLAMLSKSKMIVHAWMRSGAASPHRGVCEFMSELWERIPPGFQIEAVRADSGFYSDALLRKFESLNLPYVVVAKMSKPFKKWCAGLDGWQRLRTDEEITEAMYQSSKWDAPRRMIVRRRIVRKENGLFEIIDYEYRAMVTSLTTDPVQVWRFYNGRGDCENRIKELKYDFNADGFCLKKFEGTEAAFRLIIFTFNLIAFFKATVLQDPSLTLSTIRNRILVIGALVGSRGRQILLRLGLKGRWRDEFQRILTRLDAMTASTAAQFAELLETNNFYSPSPWRLRTNPLRALLPN